MSREFRLILRVLGADVDGTKKVPFGLSRIRGVGPNFAQAVVKVARISPEARIGSLSETEIERLWESRRRLSWKRHARQQVGRRKRRRSSTWETLRSRGRRTRLLAIRGARNSSKLNSISLVSTVSETSESLDAMRQCSRKYEG